jgi:hypothetical protein
VTGVTVVGVRGHLVAVEAHVGRHLDFCSRLMAVGLVQSGVQQPAAATTRDEDTAGIDSAIATTACGESQPNKP